MMNTILTHDDDDDDVSNGANKRAMAWHYSGMNISVEVDVT